MREPTARVENVGVEKSGADRRGGKCRSGKCGSKQQGWKMQEWKNGEQIAAVENAGVGKPHGQPNRYYTVRDLF